MEGQRAASQTWEGSGEADEALGVVSDSREDALRVLREAASTRDSKFKDAEFYRSALATNVFGLFLNKCCLFRL